MARNKLVTQEKVAEVKSIKEHYPDMTNEMVGKLADMSGATVGRILRGEYDPKPVHEPEPDAKKADDDALLLLMELADLMERNNRLLASLVLMKASDFDPTATKDKSIAEAMRKVARENAPIRAKAIEG